MKIARALQPESIAFTLSLHAVEITVQTGKRGVSISPDLFGVFSENLKYAAFIECVSDEISDLADSSGSWF